VSEGNGGAISPDGKLLAFAATDEKGMTLLWVRSLDSLAAAPLSGTVGAAFPFWSPDSRYIGFGADGGLKKIAAVGGPVQTLCECLTSVGRGGTWSTDGVIVFQPRIVGPLFRVSANGGEPEAVTRIDESRGQRVHRWPSFLPDGRHFLFFADATRTQAARERTLGIFVGSLDSGETKWLLSADEHAAYSATGHLLFTREGTLYGQRFDVKRLEVSGEPFPIAQDISRIPGSLAAFSVSASGTLTYRTGGSATSRLTWVDRAGKTLGTVGRYSMPMLSPDEKRVVFLRTDGQTDVWTLDLARDVSSRLTFTQEAESSPIWSPDGSRVAFASLRGGRWGIYQKSAAGTGSEERLLEQPELTGLQTPYANHWSPDGKRILFFFNKVASPGDTDLWLLPLSGDRKPEVYLQSEFYENEAQFSPDGRWVAYASNETGRYEVYVQPFPASGAKWQVSTSGGRQPLWRRDGRELFFVADDRRFSAVNVLAGSTFEVGTAAQLFSMQANLMNQRNSYHPTADGQRFLVNMLLDTDASPITVVVNWHEELKRLVPVN
jgi:Tol biopolymer transport system component